ncbi:unnamed protein product [Blepharisma stoltei]|uniref:Ycf1 n=1 Tax=Blepharisma stoltei TaxID=1481888 RepID=A0AAU9K7V7_9CILI|nr:unnamed protein product [Blepharisma stoltei]
MSVKAELLDKLLDAQQSKTRAQSPLKSGSRPSRFSRIPYYLKKDLPDRRFLAVRLDIHKRNIDNLIPDTSFFESMIQDQFKRSSAKKKRRRHKYQNIYKLKQQQYQNFFTNGEVEFKRENLVLENENSSLSDAEEKLKAWRYSLSSKKIRPNHENRKSVDFERSYLVREAQSRFSEISMKHRPKTTYRN